VAKKNITTNKIERRLEREERKGGKEFPTAEIDYSNAVCKNAKYILKEGQDIEKRELLGCLKSKIVLKNKEIRLL